MGWRQDPPEFQLEVGYANLTLGIWALVAAVSGWGLSSVSCLLSANARYLFCALLLHLSQARAPDGLHDPAIRKRAIQSVFLTGFFVPALFRFNVVALVRAGVLPFFQLYQVSFYQVLIQDVLPAVEPIPADQQVTWRIATNRRSSALITGRISGVGIRTPL